MCNFEFLPSDPLNKIIILLYIQSVCVCILMPERWGDAGDWELICILIMNSGRSRQTTGSYFQLLNIVGPSKGYLGAVVCHLGHKKDEP